MKKAFKIIFISLTVLSLLNNLFSPYMIAKRQTINRIKTYLQLDESESYRGFSNEKHLDCFFVKSYEDVKNLIKIINKAKPDYWSIFGPGKTSTPACLVVGNEEIDYILHGKFDLENNNGESYPFHLNDKYRQKLIEIIENLPVK